MTVVILLNLFPGTLHVAADTEEPERNLQWTVIDKPGITGFTVVSPSDVSEIAIGSSVCYVSDIPNTTLYRSRNSGYYWEDITSYLNGEGATLPVTKLAVAPDESSIIAAATDGGTALYLSVDGGITWGNMNMGVTTGTIQSIAISETYGEDNEQRDIMVGTALYGDNLSTGQVLLLHLGSYIPVWKDLDITVDPAHIGADVCAVAFSSKYADDQTILAIASTGGELTIAANKRNRTFACMAKVDLSTHKAEWYQDPNYPIELFDITHYPALTKSLGDDIGVTSIAGGIEVPSSFSISGSSSSSSIFYAFYTVDPGAAITPTDDTSNTYKIDDSIPQATAFRPTTTGTQRYCSIALCSGKLLAGEIFPSTDPGHTISVPVQLCNDPSASPPQFNSTSYPYGAGNALVACSGNKAYCGTGQHPVTPSGLPDESGFSVSDDNGGTWFQISLIDTDLMLQDVAVASSPQSIFLASTSTTDVQSVWRSAGTPLGRTWGRILAYDKFSSNEIIIRVSPAYREDYTVYVCEVGSTGDYSELWVSTDRGNRWTQYKHVPRAIIDLAPAGDEILYLALPEGRVEKSVTNGHYWLGNRWSELPEIAMLSVVDADTILVAGDHGDVAYTTDGAGNFTRIPEIAGFDSPVQVVADSNYDDNHLIYSGNANVIHRWTIGQSSDWERARVAADGEKISGMVTVEGILYALWYKTGSPSGAERSLQPAVTFVDLEWDSLQAGAESAVFDRTPTTLRYTTTETCVILWTIDTASDEIMVYFDCLAWQNPQQTLDNEAVIGCDPATGRAQEVNFTWDDICADNRYQLQLAKDNAFSKMVFDSGDTMPFLLPADIQSPSLIYFEGNTSPALGIQAPTLECGHTYYWRVRARAAVTGDIVRSPWSDIRSFTIKAGFKVTTPYYGPQLLAPDNDCGCNCNAPVCFSWSPYKETTQYRFELADNADMNSPMVSTSVTATAYRYDGQLECNKGYFWRVCAEEPAPSEWSSVFSFTVGAEEDLTYQSPSSSSTSVSNKGIPLYAWVMITLCVAFIIVATTLIISLMRGTGRIK